MLLSYDGIGYLDDVEPWSPTPESPGRCRHTFLDEAQLCASKQRPFLSENWFGHWHEGSAPRQRRDHVEVQGRIGTIVQKLHETRRRGASSMRAQAETTAALTKAHLCEELRLLAALRHVRRITKLYAKGEKKLKPQPPPKPKPGAYQAEFASISQEPETMSFEDRRVSRRSELGLDGFSPGREKRQTKVDAVTSRHARLERKQRYSRSSTARSSNSPSRTTAAAAEHERLVALEEKKPDKDMPMERRRLKRGTKNHPRSLKDRGDASLPFYVVAWSPETATRLGGGPFLPDLALDGHEPDAGWWTPGRDESWLCVDFAEKYCVSAVELKFGPNDEQKPRTGEFFRAARTATRCPNDPSAWISLLSFEVPVSAQQFKVEIPRADGLVPTRWFKLLLGEAQGTSRHEKKVLAGLSFSVNDRSAKKRDVIARQRTQDAEPPVEKSKPAKSQPEHAAHRSSDARGSQLLPTPGEEMRRPTSMRVSLLPSDANAGMTRESIARASIRPTLTGITERDLDDEQSQVSEDYDMAQEEKRRDLAAGVRNKLRHRLRMAAFNNASWLDDWSCAKVHMFSPEFESKEDAMLREICATYALDKVLVDDVYKVFASYDQDGSAQLEYPEFARMMPVLLGGKKENKGDGGGIPDQRMKFFWNVMDSDGSGTIDFEEFLLWYFHNFVSAENPRKDPMTNFYEQISSRRPQMKPQPRLEDGTRAVAGSMVVPQDGWPVVPQSGGSRLTIA